MAAQPYEYVYRTQGAGIVGLIGATAAITVGGTDTLDAADEVYVANDAVTITVPTAVGIAGKVYRIVRRTAAGTVTINSAGGNLLCQQITVITGVVTVGAANADTDLSLTLNGAGVQCYSDGTDWQCTAIGVGVDDNDP